MNFFASLNRIFRIAFRNKTLTLINIAGLGIGLAVAMFLLVYLNFEYSYDKHFKDKDRIYRILTVWEEGDIVNNYPICLWTLADGLSREVPEVETVSRLFRSGGLFSANDSKEKLGANFYMVDSSFLNIFDFKPVYGELKDALNIPGKSIITRSAAERFFGQGVNPVGSSLNQDKEVYQIVAVIEDVPANSHLKFDMLAKLPDFGWGGLEYFTYLKLRPGVDAQVAIDKCNALNKKMTTDRFVMQNSRFNSIMEPLVGLHISTQASFDLSPTTNQSNLFFIILVVIFVLGIAICNFISLYVIQGEKRATEISVRKTNGAGRGGIVKMLFGETFTVTLLAFLLAIVLYYSGSNAFAHLINFNLPPDVGISSVMWGNFILLFLGIALIAGGYPAYYLSRFNPAELIRKTVTRKYRLTSAAVVIQFSAVIFCISALLIVGRQLNYVKNLPLGFDAENVFVTSLGKATTNAQFESYRAELMKYPEIISVSLSQGHPASGYSGQGIRNIGQSEQEDMSIDERRVGPGYLDTYRISIMSGRNFSDNLVADSTNLILSETAAKMLGIKEAIGQKVLYKDQEFILIGIAQDIHSSSAHEKIGPVVYTAYLQWSQTLSVRFQEGMYEKAKADVLSVLTKQLEGVPLSTILMKDIVNDQYKQDEITIRILISGTVMAILLALLGLLALSGFVAQQKRKEISVRRVLGAQVGEIVFDLNRYIIIRILPAVPVGIALSWYVMARWLNGFQYSLTITWWVFALALLITLLVVLLTTFYQSFHAATSNPVDALKSE